ncbi:MAG: AI-2E family transporter [Gammaproteobacteria bacterium]|nr:AI-2E family transporter [Gammaproteobacteria bacterium]NIR85982.1 AI-2E family transporter [Gammaproteobacteria bacterium]NIR91973.1 AI-2E family transporter [Gammaproteobacteria bacterium]NIU07223.1 AI-2E family transporter [Gammaproteobacteria bacterium]NIV54026.1 AI-2E family transporter [Gammaproteobacteria bacterium]
MTDAQKWLLVVGALATGWVVYLLSPILTPFLLAAILGYLGDPLVEGLARRRVPRTAAAALILAALIVVMAALPLLLLPLVEMQIRALAGMVPAAVEWIELTVVPWLQSTLGVDPSLFQMERIKELLAQHWQQAGDVAVSVLQYATRSGAALIGFLVSFLIVPVVTFYLLRDWGRLIDAVHGLLPRSIEPMVSELARDADERLGAFLKGQLLVMLALGIIYWVGLWIAGLDLAFIVGMLAGLVSFVPYLGVIVGVVLASVAMLFQTHELLPLLPVLVVFAVGQVLEGTVLTPLLVGDRIGLHPVAVIFAVMAGGQLFGFLGVLLALPVAAVLAVLVRRAHRSYKASAIYRGGGAAPSG